MERAGIKPSHSLRTINSGSTPWLSRGHNHDQFFFSRPGFCLGAFFFTEFTLCDKRRGWVRKCPRARDKTNFTELSDLPEIFAISAKEHWSRYRINTISRSFSSKYITFFNKISKPELFKSSICISSV